MANYYKTNAIYDALQYGKNFVWVSGNAWILIYGNKQAVPKLIALIKGKSWKEQEKIIDFVDFLSKKSDLPKLHIEFDDSENIEIETVIISNDQHNKEKISLDSLKGIFKNSGLDIKNEACAKYLNDKTSSAYHIWQRKSLGYNITVSDVDLVRLQNNTYVEIIELKRSFIKPTVWQPFSDDFANFNLLYNLSIKLNLCFTIVYNQRLTKPHFSDIKEPLSIFEYSLNSTKKIANNISFEDFIRGIYHIYFTSSKKKYVDVPFCNIETDDLKILSRLNTTYKQNAIIELNRRNEKRT